MPKSSWPPRWQHLKTGRGQRRNYRRSTCAPPRGDPPRRNAARGQGASTVAEHPGSPRRCGTDLKVASHSVGAGFPPNRARSRAQPLRAPVCHALRTSVQSAPILKTDPHQGSSDAGICNPDMESPAGQNNAEKFRTEPSIHSTPRVIQRPSSIRSSPG